MWKKGDGFLEKDERGNGGWQGKVANSALSRGRRRNKQRGKKKKRGGLKK